MLKRRLTQAGNEEHMQSLRRSLQMFRSEFRRGLRQGNSYSGTTSREHTKSNTSNAQAERGRCGRKLLIPKILGTAAVKREGENAARKGKNAEETLTHVAISTLGELKTLRLGFIKTFE